MNPSSNKKARKSAARPKYKTNPFLTYRTDSDEDYEKRNSPTKSHMLKSGKVKYSLQFMEERMRPTNEELIFRKNKLNESNIVENSIKLFHCTKCKWSYKTAIKNGEKISVHPFLGVLMCEKCCEYYGDGNFSIDSDGEDKYCRWCGEGGTIFTCSNCIYGFCHACMKKHFGVEFLQNVLRDENWLCFFCDSKPLWDLRFVCSLVEQVSESQRLSEEKQEMEECNQTNLERIGKEVQVSNSAPVLEGLISTILQKNIPKGKRYTKTRESPRIKSIPPTNQKIDLDLSPHRNNYRRNIISSSDESDEEEQNYPKKRSRLHKGLRGEKDKNSFSSKKTEVLSKLRNVLQLTKHQMSSGISWSSETISKLSHSECIETSDDLLEECHKIKWFLSILSSHLVELCNNVESIERILPISNNPKTVLKDPHSGLKNDLASYSGILGFLGFVTNQVKTFMNKGIKLQDLLDAEIYNDANVLGIKKKPTSPTGEKELKINSPTIASECVESEKNNDSDSDGSGKSDTTVEFMKSLKSTNDKESLMDILAILENA